MKAAQSKNRNAQRENASGHWLPLVKYDLLWREASAQLDWITYKNITVEQIIVDLHV